MNVVTLQTFSVTGLSCQNCVKHVSGALRELPGVHSVAVDLHPEGASTIRVEAAAALSDDQVAAALAQEGDYSLLR